MLELGTYGSVRGALSNERPYRDAATRPPHHEVSLCAALVNFSDMIDAPFTAAAPRPVRMD